MRILIVTEEDEFYLPLAIDYLLSHCPHTIAAVVCARNPLLPSKWKAAKKFYTAFGLWPIVQHACRIGKVKVKSSLPFLNRDDRQYSVEDVCQKYQMPCRTVDNVNAPDFI